MVIEYGAMRVQIRTQRRELREREKEGLRTVDWLDLGVGGEGGPARLTYCFGV